MDKNGKTTNPATSVSGKQYQGKLKTYSKARLKYPGCRNAYHCNPTPARYKTMANKFLLIQKRNRSIQQNPE